MGGVDSFRGRTLALSAKQFGVHLLARASFKRMTSCEPPSVSSFFPPARSIFDADETEEEIFERLRLEGYDWAMQRWTEEYGEPFFWAKRADGSIFERISGCFAPVRFRAEGPPFSEIDAKARELNSMRGALEGRYHALVNTVIKDTVLHSNKLEGSSLGAEEVHALCDTGTLPVSLLNQLGRTKVVGCDVAEALGVKRGMEAVLRPRSRTYGPVTAELLRDFNTYVTGTNGAWREDLLVLAARRLLMPLPQEFRALMSRFVTTCAAEEAELHPLVHSAVQHWRLVRIHPWADGNGRSARMLTDYLLVRANLVPAIILSSDGAEYHDALGKFDNGAPGDFVHFVARSVNRVLDLYLAHASAE